MSSYNDFALFYDSLTENVNYKVRSEYISNFFYSNGIKDGKILDLACGTGSISIEFAKMGFDVIGVDMSLEMLTEANMKATSNGQNILFVNQKMEELELPYNIDGCICSLDSINHLTSINDVQKTFSNVSKYLNKGGIFVFDVNTIYKHNFVLNNNVFVYDTDDVYLVWSNENLENNVVNICLDMFIEQDGLYERTTEEFEETAFSVDELKKALNFAKLEILGIYDELTLEKPKEQSERLYFVCKKTED